MDTALKLARLARRGLIPGGETARVVAVNEAALNCTVETAAGLELEQVPLRVLNVADDVGIYAVPVAGSDVRLAFDGGDPGRPRVAAVQEFDRVVFKKKGGVRVEITRDDKIILGGKAAVPAALGKEVTMWMASVWGWMQRNVVIPPEDPFPPSPGGAAWSKVVRIE